MDKLMKIAKGKDKERKTEKRKKITKKQRHFD